MTLVPFQMPETPEQILATLHEVQAAIAEKEFEAGILEEATMLTDNFPAFVREAWKQLEPHTPFLQNWHIDAICEHLDAVSRGHIKRLQVWVPPGSCKSRLVSVYWPAWEWTHNSELRYWSGSYDIGLAAELASYTRDLMVTPWYLERFGREFKMTKMDANFYQNNQGGHRLATAPGSRGSGVHGHRIIIDDPLNALASNATSKAKLEEANRWYTDTISTRGIGDFKEVIIMQRLAALDFAAHALQFGEWEVLCLPEEYEKNHPFAWSKDPRTVEGELLWPDKRGAEEHAILVKKLGSKAAGQLQQRPSQREGQVIPRSGWRYYPKDFQEKAEAGDVSKLPKFRSLICSWDTTFKDKNTSDYVAGGIWGVHGSNRYLLKTFHQQVSLSATKTAMIEFRKWCLDRWPTLPVRILIEKSANGVEIIDQLRSEITGVIAVPVSTDKMTRAEACEPDFNGESVWVPGKALPSNDDYDQSATPAWVTQVIEQASAFPLGEHDDLVDMVTMALNWVRTHQPATARTTSAYKGKPRTTSPLLARRYR